MITKQDLVELAHEDAEHYRSLRDKMKYLADMLDLYHDEDVSEGFTPRTTAEAMISSFGQPVTEILIASLVNRHAWDGRIGDKNKEWAIGVEQAFDADAMRKMGVSAKMHLTHLDQIADAMRKICKEQKSKMDIEEV